MDAEELRVLDQRQSVGMKTVTERFDEKVDKSSPCWEWCSAKNYGYGVFWLNGGNVYAHRLSYERYIGPVPRGMFVCHKCDNAACVNPDHLFLGTALDNMRDKINKGRAIYPGAKHQTRGADHPHAKLGELSVQRIRIVGNALSLSRIATIHRVSKQTIHAILRRHTWTALSNKQALA